ncbi:24961_t:CDS:2, partial [Cetraspora pellucida]
KYPQESKLLYTRKPGKYKIPNNYIVHTSYGKKNNQKTVICSIYYCGKDAKFRVVYGNKHNDYVESKESSSAVANLYQKAIESKTKKKKFK